MGDDKLISRKTDHLKVIAGGGVEHAGSTLLEELHLVHIALPELDLDRINTSTDFFGKRLGLPLMITSMTGGVEQGAELNSSLAQLAARHNIAFAVGSQRVVLRYPERIADFAVRKYIPDGVLLGNIGGQQLLEYEPAEVSKLADAIEADGLCVHLNPAHELAQPEGDRDFAGILDGIKALGAEMPGKVLVKEVGHGLAPEVVADLASAGIQYIDVSGAGGTSWTKVEAKRSEAEGSTGDVFGDWGIPLGPAIITARQAAPEACIIASGGLGSGLDIAKAIAAGASLAGMARLIYLAFENGGTGACDRLIGRLDYDLRCAMLLTGSPDLATLKQARRVYTGTLLDWLEQLPRR